MNQSLDISTIAIADKVNRYVQARYYAIQLAALQKSVQKIGGDFVQQADSDYLPYKVEEHLALAVILARESYLLPKESPSERYRLAESRLDDGFAVILLREILSALGALGLRLRIRPEGYDWKALKEERLEWESNGASLPIDLLTDDEIEWE